MDGSKTRRVKGRTWLGPKVVQSLPLAYADHALGESKPLEGMHYLSLNANVKREENQFLIFFLYPLITKYKPNVNVND